MVDAKCMIVILIFVCVYDDVLRGGGGELESIFRNETFFFVLFWGNVV